MSLGGFDFNFEAQANVKPLCTIYSMPAYRGEEQVYTSFGRHKALNPAHEQSQLINKTFYIIHAVTDASKKEYALDNGGTDKQGSKFHLWEWSKDNMNQVFTMLPNGVIKCVKNSMVMDVINGSFTAGNQLQCYPQNNTDAQLWTYDYKTYTLKSKNKPFVLNLNNNEHKNDAVINIAPPNKSDAQKWEIRLCEVKQTFITGRYAETFTVNYNAMNLSRQKETFNTCQAQLYQHTNRGGASSGWVGIGDYNFDPYFTQPNQKPRTWNTTNTGARNGAYSTESSNGVGEFAEWVGKKFYIRCRQNRNFALDTRSFQSNGRGDDSGFCGIWTFDPNQVNQIWTIDAYGHLGPANNRRYILGAPAGSHQGSHPRMVDNGNGQNNGQRWRLYKNSICHQNGNNMPFLHVEGARMANGTRVGHWATEGARGQGNCTWELQECGWQGNESNGFVRNDDISSIALKPFTNVIIYEHGFSGRVLSIHNGAESDWLVNLTDHGFNDTLSSYKVRAGVMDGKREVTKNDISGNAVCTIRYKTHNANVGWSGWVNAGNVAGHGSHQLEAIQFEYTGPGQMYARAHVAGIGWLDWVTNGVTCGTTGQGRRMEAVQFKIDGASNVIFSAQMNCAGKGWLNGVGLNGVCGTTGQGRAGLQIKVSASLQGVPMISNMAKLATVVNVVPNTVINMSIGKFEPFIGKPFALRSRGNGTFVIDTEGHQNGGGVIKIYQKVEDFHVNQTWTVDKDGHLISWQNRNSILYIDNANNGTRPYFIGWKGNEAKANSPNSKWRLNNDGQIESLANPNQLFDISGAKYTNNTPILMWGKHGGANQKWDLVELKDANIGKLAGLIGKPFYIKSKGNGTFVIDTEGHQNGGGVIKIYQKVEDFHVNQTWTTDKEGHLISWQNRNSILYLDNANNGTRPTIIGWKGNEAKANSFKARWCWNNDGQLETIESRNQVLDISGAKYANNTPVLIWGKHNGANQKWDLIECANTDIGKLNALIDKPFYIRSKGNGTFVVDTEGHQNGGGPIKIYQKVNDFHENQTWTTNKLGQLISWQNRNSILYLPNTSNGTRPTIIGIKGNEAQANSLNARWCLNNDGQLESMAARNQVFDISGAKYANNTPVLIWPKHGGANQKWDAIEAVNLDIGNFKNYINKPFCIKSKGNGTFVIDTEGHQNGGGVIKIYQKVEDMHVNQTWTVDDKGHLISWQNRNSILYLPNTSNGTRPTIIGWKGNEAKADSLNARWCLNANGQIESMAARNQVFDISGGKYANNTPVLIWPKHGGANQKWDVTEVKAAPPPPKYSVNLVVSDNTSPMIGSIKVAPLTEVIIYVANADSKAKSKRIIVHNGSRGRGGRGDTDFGIVNFVNKYNIYAIRDIEIKECSADNKQFDKIEEYEGFEGFLSFKDEDGNVKTSTIVIIIIICIALIGAGAFVAFKIYKKCRSGIDITSFT